MDGAQFRIDNCVLQAVGTATPLDDDVSTREVRAGSCLPRGLVNDPIPFAHTLQDCCSESALFRVNYLRTRDWTRVDFRDWIILESRDLLPLHQSCDHPKQHNHSHLCTDLSSTVWQM